MVMAQEAFVAKKYDDARKLLREAASLDPKSPMPWLGLVEVAELTKDPKGAREGLEKASSVAPDRVEPAIAWGRWHASQQAFDEAEAAFRRAAQLDPKSPLPLFELGNLYWKARNNPDKALELYREAVRIGPKHAESNYNLGLVLLARNDVLGSLAPLRAAQDLAEAKTPMPSLNLGRAYLRARKWKEAKEAFTRALAIQPNLAAAYVGRASVYVESGDAANALSDLNKAEQLDPKNPEAAFRLGMLYQEQHAFKEAYAAYERVLALDPKSAAAYNNLAWIAATRHERLDEALVWIQKARTLTPKDSTLHDTQGWVLRAKGDLDAAMAVLSEGIALAPSADLHYHLGVIQMEKGRTDDARSNIRKALQIQPDFGEARDAKARLKALDTPPAAAK